MSWPQEVWTAAVAAYKSGWRMPEKRFPIIISADNPVSTPEKLRELADLPSVPEISNTTKTSPFSDGVDEGTEPEKVQICDVNWSQLVKIEERTEWDEICVWFQNTKRMALVVLSLKVKEQAGSKITQTLP